MQISKQCTWISLNLTRISNQARRWVEGVFSSSIYISSNQLCKREPPKASHKLFISPLKVIVVGWFQWAAVDHTRRVLVHIGRVQYEPRQRLVLSTIWKLTVASNSDKALDFPFGTYRTVSSGTERKLRELRIETQHRTVNSDASGVALDANSGTLCGSSFHWTLYTRLKHRESCKLSSHRTLTLDMSDLILDASGLTSDMSGLYALHETIFNYFPCFHVSQNRPNYKSSSVETID